MKIGELWQHRRGGIWKIIHIFKHSETIIIECVKSKKEETMTRREKLLNEIFGEIDKVGTTDEYDRENFIEVFSKIY